MCEEKVKNCTLAISVELFFRSFMNYISMWFTTQDMLDSSLTYWLQIIRWKGLVSGETSSFFLKNYLKIFFFSNEDQVLKTLLSKWQLPDYLFIVKHVDTEMGLRIRWVLVMLVKTFVRKSAFVLRILWQNKTQHIHWSNWFLKISD